MIGTSASSSAALKCHLCPTVDRQTLYRANPTGRPGVWTCEDHWSRVPCAIEDCRRTADRKNVGGDWLCRDHWRRYVPPHNAIRRIYNRNWRRFRAVEKLQDTPGKAASLAAARRRVDAFWLLIVKRARRLASEGVLDEAEINRFMGWAA